jgi:His/Glu/Gln/Arg/opine family amino acid ABC transporter permease subunit
VALAASTLMLPVLQHNFPYLLRGAGVTLLLSLGCIALSTLLGLPIAILQLFAGWPGRLLAGAYVAVMRGIPLIVLLIAMYYVLPYTGIDLDPVTGGVLVVSLYFAAYMGEVFRAAILSLPAGQWDAGRALGMHGWRLMTIVVVPQALRLAGPPFVNTCIMLVKSTSLVSVIGLWELTMAGRQVTERTLAPFQMFGGVAALYFIMCYALALCGQAMERRLPHAA